MLVASKCVLSGRLSMCARAAVLAGLRSDEVGTSAQGLGFPKRDFRVEEKELLRDLKSLVVFFERAALSLLSTRVECDVFER